MPKVKRKSDQYRQSQQRVKRRITSKVSNTNGIVPLEETDGTCSLQPPSRTQKTEKIQTRQQTANARERKRRTEMKRLLSPSKRAKHKELLRNAPKRRMGDPEERLHQCKILRKAQEDRLRDSGSRIISQLSKTNSSSIVGDQTKDEQFRRFLFNKFNNEKKEGPTYVCSSCQRLWFKTSVVYSKICKLDLVTLTNACGVIDGDEVCLCRCCYRIIRNNKMPILSLGNQELRFPEIPREKTGREVYMPQDSIYDYKSGSE
jgi:hypothetical protein